MGRELWDNIFDTFQLDKVNGALQCCDPTPMQYIVKMSVTMGGTMHTNGWLIKLQKRQSVCDRCDEDDEDGDKKAVTCNRKGKEILETVAIMGQG